MTGHDDTSRVALGRATYASNFDVEEARAEEMMTARSGRIFTNEAFTAAGGPGWQGTALNDRDRAIAVVAALVSQHVTDERLDVYLGLARRAGVTDEGLESLMVLLAAYVGQPATSLGARAVLRVIGSSEERIDGTTFAPNRRR